MKNIKTKLLLIIILLIASRFWIGVYSGAEFGGNSPFIKHRPIWKWHFHSPLGMSDKTLDDLSPEDQKEELLFQEFIVNQRYDPL